jgi:survival-of-motor-neuron-related-splicing factor 30
MIEAVGTNEEMAGLQKEINGHVALHEEAIARLKSELAALQAELPAAPEPAAPKFDPEKHPLLRKAIEKQEPEKAIVYSTGDVVEAQWSDRSWYKAKVQSVLGSASAPKYVVRFIEYDDSLTVDGHAIRPLAHKRKRELDAVATASPAMPVTSTPHVISGPASLNPNAQLVKKNTIENDSKPKLNPHNIANQGVLKKRKNNWQEFTNSKMAKSTRKESQFRTSTEVNSRGAFTQPLADSGTFTDVTTVGFTNSGRPMTETVARKRYDRKADAELDEEANHAHAAPPAYVAPPRRERY